MELLNNQGLILKSEGLLHLHFYEFRALIESILELCQKGEISFYEAKDAIGSEWSRLMMNVDLLMGTLINLESEEDDGKARFIMGFGYLDKTGEKKLYKNVLDEMRDYLDFIDKSEGMLNEIPESKEYQQKRKAKIKSEIIQDGLTLLLKNIDKTQVPKEEYIDLPPVFNDVLKEGLISNIPVGGKFFKMGDKKDMDIIKHIVDNSPYADTLTAELYIQYIHTGVKPQTIGQYISRANSEAKEAK